MFLLYTAVRQMNVRFVRKKYKFYTHFFIKLLFFSSIINDIDDYVEPS
jgi:hypothetical protein